MIFNSISRLKKRIRLANYRVKNAKTQTKILLPVLYKTTIHPKLIKIGSGPLLVKSLNVVDVTAFLFFCNAVITLYSSKMQDK